MGLFVGSHENPIDKKGRVSIPAPLRAALGEPVRSVFVFPSVDPQHRCIVIWSVAEMEQFVAKMRRTFRSMNEKQRKTAKRTVRSSRQITVDDTGRMQLPAKMLEYLGVTNSVMFAGDGFYCSIWAPETFKADMDEAEAEAIEDGEDVLMELMADDEDEAL